MPQGPALPPHRPCIQTANAETEKRLRQAAGRWPLRIVFFTPAFSRREKHNIPLASLSLHAHIWRQEPLAEGGLTNPTILPTSHHPPISARQRPEPPPFNFPCWRLHNIIYRDCVTVKGALPFAYFRFAHNLHYVKKPQDHHHSFRQ